MILTRDGVAEVQVNRRKAIHLRCLDCSGFEWNEVRDCEHTDCPLYPYRTGRGKQVPASRNRAIKEYCMWCGVDQPGEITACTSLHCPLYKYRGYLAKKQHIGATSDMIV